jgi:hypothetical protein
MLDTTSPETWQWSDPNRVPLHVALGGAMAGIVIFGILAIVSCTVSVRCCVLAGKRRGQFSTQFTMVQ